MNQHEAIEALEPEWDRPRGFFARIRVGDFDPAEGARIVSIIDSIAIAPEECIERRLVSLLWYLPSFTEWQRERVADAGGDTDAYVRFINALNNALESVLGVP